MIDLHTHSLLSDGELLPGELARRYEVKGFKALAITDHADFSNLEPVVKSIVKFCQLWPEDRIQVFPGVELTHLPLNQFKDAVLYAKENGIKVVIAHGETISEPVIAGTNRAALEAGVDILSHPGFISEQDVKLAAKKKVFLEISARKGHCLCNGHVVRLALKFKAALCVNSDSHSPDDIPSLDYFTKVCLGAGLEKTYLAEMNKKIAHFLKFR